MMPERAIVHIDGDSFFVSCELLARPDLRGKAVVTGGERGIASSMNREAKALGITRGKPVFEIRRELPQVIVLESNFALYEAYNARMVAIAKRFSDVVERYSIDECFVDLTEVGETWEERVAIAHELKETLKRELGLTFSLGLAPTKTLAKVASKVKKPDGFTAMDHDNIRSFLGSVDIGDVWGIGWRSVDRFRTAGIPTALAFADMPLSWVERHFSGPFQELWNELNGRCMHDVTTKHDRMKSIQSTRMFPETSSDREYIFSHLSRDIDNAARRLREIGLVTRMLSLFIKDAANRRHWVNVELADYTNYTDVMTRHAREVFGRLFEPGRRYKAAGVTCHGLLSRTDIAGSLFEDPFKKDSIYQAVDTVTHKFGNYSIVLASSMRAVTSYQKDKTRLVARAKPFPIPFLGEVS